jgi:hypothetical protein
MIINIVIDTDKSDIRIEFKTPEKITIEQKMDILYSLDQALHKDFVKMNPIPYEV